MTNAHDQQNGTPETSSNLGAMIENLPSFLADISTKLAATSLAVATTGLPYIPAVMGVALVELIGAGQNYRSTLAFARLEEFAKKLEARVTTMDAKVVSSLEFAALCKAAFESFVHESMENKRNAIVQYVASVGSRSWDPIHDHSKIFVILERISPSEYAAFLEIVKAVDAAMQWELDHNDKKLHFQYGIGIILNQLSSIPTTMPALLREITLDSTLRTLSSLNLIHIKDSSTSSIGSSSTSIDVINVTPLGRQLITYLSPDKAFRNINREE